MSNIRSTASSSKLLPTQSVERRKKIVLVTDYRQRQHNLSRSIKVEPTRRDYIFQGQWETFLSYEDPEKDVTSAFLVLICGTLISLYIFFNLSITLDTFLITLI